MLHRERPIEVDLNKTDLLAEPRQDGDTFVGCTGVSAVGATPSYGPVTQAGGDDARLACAPSNASGLGGRRPSGEEADGVHDVVLLGVERREARV